MKHHLLAFAIIISNIAICQRVINKPIYNNYIFAANNFSEKSELLIETNQSNATPILKSTLNIGGFIIKTLQFIDSDYETNDSIFFYCKSAKTPLFVFCKEQEWYDCSSVGYEWAKYEIKKDSVIIYSLYAHQGGTNGHPFGVRKKIYVVNNSEAKLITNNMFLEERYTSGNGAYIEGVEYILNKPKVDSEQQKLDVYVNRIEQDYGGGFLLFENGEQLLKEVRSKFMPMIKAKINEWKKHEAPYNRFKI